MSCVKISDVRVCQNIYPLNETDTHVSSYTSPQQARIDSANSSAIMYPPALRRYANLYY